MKRISIIILLIVAFLNPIMAQSDYVIDKADILSESEEVAIADILDDLKVKHQIDFVLYIDDEYVDGNIKYQAADIYDYSNIYDDQGVMLYINMANREYFALTTGDDTIYRLSDYALDQANNKMANELSLGNYFDGVKLFFSDIDYYLDYYNENAVVYDKNIANQITPKEKMQSALTISFVLATLISGVVGFALFRQLKTIKKQNNATDYAIDDNGFLKANINKSRDLFLYRTISRTKIERNNSSGGSSSFNGSSGVSHGGRGGSF